MLVEGGSGCQHSARLKRTRKVSIAVLQHSIVDDMDIYIYKRAHESLKLHDFIYSARRVPAVRAL